MRSSLIRLIRFYQLAISPWLGNRCRFEPSCSAFAQTAIETHGVWRGSVLAIKRISRCHPWHPGGYDPVPPSEAQEARRDETRCAVHCGHRHS